MTMTTTGEPTSQLVEMQAYAEGPPSRIDIFKTAPFGWWPAILIALAAFIDRAEGAITLGAAGSLQDQFGFDDAFLGVLAGAPAVAALLFVIPAGRWADNRKRKNILVVVVILWSLCTFGTGAAVSLAMFTTFRILLGAATPLNLPASSSLLGDYFPRRSRTKAFGLLRAFENIGLPVGTLIGAVVGGLVGWRAAFFVVAIPALILAGVIWVVLREPRRGVGDEISALVEGALDDQSAAGATAEPAGALPFAQAAPGAAATTTTEMAGPPVPPPPGFVPLAPPESAQISGPTSASVVSDQPSDPVTAVPPPPPHGFAADVDQLVETYGQPEFGPASRDVVPTLEQRRPKGFFDSFRIVFRIPTVRRLVFGQTVLYAAFAGFFAFATLFFARTYFNTETLFNVSGASAVQGSAQAKAGIVVAGSSIFAIGFAAAMAARIDERFAATNPRLRVTAALFSIAIAFVSLLVFVTATPFAVVLTAFLVFAGVNIVAVTNLSAAIADTLPAYLRGAGFSVFQFLLAFGAAFGALGVGIGSAAFGNNLRYGFAVLLIPLLIGGLVVARALKSYVKDADAVVAEASLALAA